MSSSNILYQYIIRFRWLIILGSLLLTTVFGTGMKNLAFNPDSRVFFSESNPQLIALEELEDTFIKNENVYIAIRSNVGDIFSRDTLQIIKELSDASWQIPFSNRVDSISNFQHMDVQEDDLIVEDLVGDDTQLTPEAVEKIKQIVLNEHELLHRMVNPQGTMAGININVLKPGESLDEVPTIVHYVENLIQQYRSKYPQHSFYLTGSVPFDQAFSQVSQDDSASLVPLMYLIIIVGVGLLLRSITASIATLIVIGFSTVVAMGLMGHIGLMITSPTAVAPVIIMTLAVADSVHILSTLFTSMRQGMDKHAAIVESLRINMKPVLITSLTTAIGFLSMNSSDVPPFQELGNIVAVGVMAAFVFSVFLLPAIIAVLPIRVKIRSSYKETYSDRIANFVISNRKGLLIINAIFMLILTLGILRIELNDNFINYLDDIYQIRLDTELIAQEELTGLDIIEYTIDSGASGAISSPEFLNDLDKLGKWFEAQPDVLTVATFADIIKRLNQKLNADNETLYSIPDSAALTAQYLLLYEMSLPYGLDLNNRIDIDKSKTRLTVIMKRTSAKKLREIGCKTI